MHIFSISNDVDIYNDIKALDSSRISVLIERRWQSLEAGWKPIDFIWEYQNEKKPDMFLTIGFVFIVNKKTMDIFQTELNIIDVEYLPVNIGGEEYYIVNICGFQSDAVDLDRSQVRYGRNGRVAWIYDFAFNNGVEYPSLFRVSELKTALFATDDLVNLVTSHKLTGLKFTLCAL